MRNQHLSRLQHIGICAVFMGTMATSACEGSSESLNEQLAPQDTTAQDPPASTATEGALIHEIPSLPILLDGEPKEPEFLSTLNGKPVFFVADTEARARGFVRVFTTLAKAEAFLATLPKPLQPDIPEGALASESPRVVLYDNVNFQRELGSVNRNLPDFNCPWQSWFSCFNINDRVGSVANYTGRTAWFYDGLKYSGDWHGVPAHSLHEALGDWNNRFSSMLLYP